MNDPQPVSLYLVPTPIGNLEDITFRAVRILKEVNLVLAEDTRTSSKLFKHYEIKTPLKSHHTFNEHSSLTTIIAKLQEGAIVALISDAGTPGISDPGFLLVRECLKNGLKVECLPGATAFVPALVKSGLPCDSFVFEGFLPPKKGRQTKFKELAEQEKTMIFYESPYRLQKTLEELKNYLGAEETINGSLEEIIAYYQTATIKGEIVIVVSGKE